MPLSTALKEQAVYPGTKNTKSKKHLSNPQQGDMLAVDSSGDITVSPGGVIIIRTEQRDSATCVQRKRFIFRDDAQERQSGGVDGIIDSLMEGLQQFFSTPIDHEMDLSPAQGGELHNSSLGVAEAAGVGSGDHDGAVRAGEGELEAGAEACWGIDDTEIEALPYFREQRLELFQADVGGVDASGGGQEKKVFLFWVRDGGILQGAASIHDVGKIHNGAVGQSEGDIEVSETDVAIEAECRVSQLGQRHAHVSGKRSFTCTALTGNDGNDLTHKNTSFTTAGQITAVIF